MPKKKMPGAAASKQTQDEVKKKLQAVYKQAKDEIQQKMDAFVKKQSVKQAVMDKKLAEGKITSDEYNAWLKSVAFAAQQWTAKMDQISETLAKADEEALQIINQEKMGVFAENANYQSWQITQDTGLDLSFAVYDADAVGRLIEKEPELLPRKEINGKKEDAWNRKEIANAVSQGIIQGESLPKIAQRIAHDTASQNGSAMMRYARTAMTAAQNAGRMHTLHRAQDMGIKCKKKWLATLDSRTRDSHAKLDGQTVDIDEPFIVDGKEIMFPGDPDADPSLVYNCRCTLVYEYENYPNDPEFEQRRDNESGEVIQGMTYEEWHTTKEKGMLNDLNDAKVELAQAQKAVIKAKIAEGHVFKGIWVDDVTYADYSAKKDKIAAKKDYYETEIKKIKSGVYNNPAKLKDLEKHLKELKTFEKNGKLLEARDNALKKVQDVFNSSGVQKTATAPALKKTYKTPVKKKTAAAAAQVVNPVSVNAGAGNGAFTADAYTKERKDKALWAKNPYEADNALRKRTGETWRNATEEEKDAIYEYTHSYHKYNEPLRGIEYGTSKYLGVGNTDLDASYAHNGDNLNKMTDIINKSTYDFDMWLNRGCMFDGMDKFFQCSPGLLSNGTEAELQKELLGKNVTEYAFMSCGSTKGKGFNHPITLNIYAPKGTKMMYVEPFSAFGSGQHRAWDGHAKQTMFGNEDETILQQGTQMRITKVERKHSRVYVDLEVVDQSHQQRWKK